MTHATDAQLLQAHHAGEPDAFPELVRRHVDWIHQVARRRVGGDVQLAEDVTQATFLVLARRSRELSPHMVLPAWLFRVACYIASNVRRRERRERRLRQREQAAATVAARDATRPEAHDWQALAPVIDELVSKLRQRDREAILLRYYRQMTYAEIGDVLHTSEEAARKRVARGLEKLRSLATRRGLTFSVAGIGATLATGLAPSTAMAAPAGTTAVITTAASTIGSTTTTTTTALAATPAALAKGVLLMTTTTKLTIGAAAAVIVLIAGTALTVSTLRRATTPAIAGPTAVPAAQEPEPASDELRYGPDGVDQYGWTRELSAAGSAMRATGIAVVRCAFDNNNVLPPDLGATLRYTDRKLAGGDVAALYLIPGDLQSVAVPEVVTASWINQNASYVYLAAGAPYESLGSGTSAGTTIMFHSPLERPFKHPKHGDVILAVYIDGHAEVLTLDLAREQIERSKRAIERALAAGRRAR